MRRMSLGFGTLMLALATASSFPGAARADIVSFAFSGAVDTLNDVGNLFGGKIQVGDPIAGTFTYNNTSPPDTNNDPAIGQYVYFKNTTPVLAAPAGLTVTLGIGANQLTIQPSYETSLLLIGIGNDRPTTLGPADTFEAGQATSFNGTTSFSNSLALLQLLDLTQTFFSNDTLPSSVNLASFNVGAFLVTGAGGTTALQAHIDGLTPVPEPASFALIGLGVIGSLLMRHRHRGGE